MPEKSKVYRCFVCDEDRLLLDGNPAVVLTPNLHDTRPKFYVECPACGEGQVMADNDPTNTDLYAGSLRQLLEVDDSIPIYTTDEEVPPHRVYAVVARCVRSHRRFQEQLGDILFSKDDQSDTEQPKDQGLPG